MLQHLCVLTLQGETKVLKLKNLRLKDFADYTCQVSVRNVCNIEDKSVTFKLTNATSESSVLRRAMFGPRRCLRLCLCLHRLVFLLLRPRVRPSAVIQLSRSLLSPIRSTAFCPSPHHGCSTTLLLMTTLLLLTTLSALLQPGSCTSRERCRSISPVHHYLLFLFVFLHQCRLEYKTLDVR